MIAISKSMVALSALISLGVVAAVDAVYSRAADQSASVSAPAQPAANQSASAQVAQRFPVTSELFSPISMTSFVGQKFSDDQAAKADRLPAASCDSQTWPYLSQDCLVSGDGTAAPKVQRVITIEVRVGENISELVRMPVADLAQR